MQKEGKKDKRKGERQGKKRNKDNDEGNKQKTMKRKKKNTIIRKRKIKGTIVYMFETPAHRLPRLFPGNKHIATLVAQQGKRGSHWNRTWEISPRNAWLSSENQPWAFSSWTTPWLFCSSWPGLDEIRITLGASTLVCIREVSFVSLKNKVLKANLADGCPSYSSEYIWPPCPLSHNQHRMTVDWLPTKCPCWAVFVVNVG